MMRAVSNIREVKLNDSSMKKRKSEDTTEADDPEPEPKETKGIVDPPPVERQTTRSVTNIQEEDSDDPSMKECRKRWVKEDTNLDLSSNSANCNKDKYANEKIVLRLGVIEKDSNDAAKTKEMKTKHATAETLDRGKPSFGKALIRT